jgi:hypothetical protein
MFASTPFWSYGPEDLAVLEDSLKLQRYVEVYTDAIAPSLRAFADLAIRKQHLCDFPDNKVMAKVFILSGLDWSTVDNGANQLINYAVYADAWAPLLKRFAAGKFNRQDAPCGIKRENCLTGMGVAGNFEVLQPTMPCPLNYCIWALSIMLGEAGKLEAELQVCPSIEFPEQAMGSRSNLSKAWAAMSLTGGAAGHLERAGIEATPCEHAGQDGVGRSGFAGHVGRSAQRWLNATVGAGCCHQNTLCEKLHRGRAAGPPPLLKIRLRNKTGGKTSCYGCC